MLALTHEKLLDTFALYFFFNILYIILYSIINTVLCAINIINNNNIIWNFIFRSFYDTLFHFPIPINGRAINCLLSVVGCSCIIQIKNDNYEKKTQVIRKYRETIS